MFLYVLMAFYAGIGWAFNARLSSMMAIRNCIYRSNVHAALTRDRCVMG